MRRRGSTSAALAVAFAAAGCFRPTPHGMPSGYERDEEACRDRRDNDGDLRVDCRDDDCLRANFCRQIIPPALFREPEDSFERCSDRIDNDEDGTFDCGDRSCQAIMELCCFSELDDETCSNGVDDDGNGFADCEDNVCANSPFVTVCGREVHCDDGRDDDGDLAYDCADADCAADPICTGAERSCDDGRDDDGNGRTDCRDPACRDRDPCAGPENTAARCTDGYNNDPDTDSVFDCDDPDCTALGHMAVELYCMMVVGPENTTARCTDGLDNDADGFVDCQDFGCCPRDGPCLDAAVADFCRARAENTLESCTDGLDNDGDRFVDCADFDCTASGLEAVLDACEASERSCTDGLDNDGDRFTDCNDFSCCPGGDCGAMAITPGVAAYCLERVEDTIERCTDGLDNNGNGFVDCADFSCARADDPAVRAVCRVQGERTFARCRDGVDQDGNGFADCNDFSCRAVVEIAYVSAVECTELGAACPMPDGSRGACLLATSSDGAHSLRVCAQVRAPCRESAAYVEPLPNVPPDAAGRGYVLDERAQRRLACQDGADNDGDGFVDCEDFDCNWDPATQDLCLDATSMRPRVCG